MYPMDVKPEPVAGFQFVPVRVPGKGAYEKGEVHNIYDVVPDSKNNAYFTDFEQGQIGRVDAKTLTLDYLPVLHEAAAEIGLLICYAIR